MRHSTNYFYYFVVAACLAVVPVAGQSPAQSNTLVKEAMYLGWNGQSDTTAVRRQQLETLVREAMAHHYFSVILFDPAPEPGLPAGAVLTDEELKKVDPATVKHIDVLWLRYFQDSSYETTTEDLAKINPATVKYIQFGLAGLAGKRIGRISIEAQPAVGGGGGEARPTKAVPDTMVARIRAQLKDARTHHYFIVLDGAIATEKALQKLDPATVTSITVLQGDDAVQQYGADAKRGAILITTAVKADAPKSK